MCTFSHWPEPSQCCAFKNVPINNTSGSVFKASVHFLNPPFYLFVFGLYSKLWLFLSLDSLWLQSCSLREDALVILSRARCIISLKPRVAVHMDSPLGCVAVWTAVVSSSSSSYSSLSLLGPVCLFDAFVTASADVILSVACLQGLPRETCLYLPPVSGILSFLFSSWGKPVL